MKRIRKTNNNIISFNFIMIFSFNSPNLQTYRTVKFESVKKLKNYDNSLRNLINMNFNMTKNTNTPPTPTLRPVIKTNPSPVTKTNTNTFFPVLNIVHNMGGGTQVYADNLADIFNIDHQLNIVNENLFELKIRNNKKKYTCNTNKLLQHITNDTIVVFHHLLTMDFKLNKTLFYNIHNGCYKKLIFIIHDYHLLFPSTPNPIKNKMKDEPTNDNLLFTNDLFEKCDLIVFNSHNCLNNYKKYINIDSYSNFIVTNTVPDILINNNITFPPMKIIYNIGIIGNIRAEHKGQQLLIKINNTLSDKTYCFKVFGYSNLKDNIYKNNVQLYGEYNNNDIFNLIKKHNIDFFMFISTFEETYSYTLSIAMQTGLPIFYNNIGCYHERLLGRQNVYAFDEDNLIMIEGLVKKMEIDACNNKNSIEKMEIDATCKHEVFSQNADYNWIISNNENIIFDIKSIENHLIYKNVCFFHFTNIGKGYEIFLEQISNIKTSGLYDKLDFIFVTMLGPHIKLCEDPKIKVVYYSPNELEWEFPTIKLIKSFSDNVNNKKINLLCRCHFSGNFWWSNTDYIKLLPLFVNKEDSGFTTKPLIEKHYIECGYIENQTTLLNDFDWRFYVNYNHHLISGGITNQTQAIKHWINYGSAEGLIANIKPLQETYYKFLNHNYKNVFNIYDKRIKVTIFDKIAYEKSLLKETNIHTINNPNTPEFKKLEIIPSLDEIIHRDDFILIVDFHCLGGGCSFFINSIISRYKHNTGFIIVRNFNNKIYWYLNDEKILEASMTNEKAIETLNQYSHTFKKIFINSIIGHSEDFINAVFKLDKEKTTITHDYSMFFDKPHILFQELDEIAKHNCYTTYW